MSAASTGSDSTTVEPYTTLAIILGASQFPKSTLSNPRSFAASARGFADYLTRQEGFGLPPENMLNLFDTEFSPDKIQEEIANWLERCHRRMAQKNTKPRDLIFYYVGHGSFSHPDEQYILAIRATTRFREGVSSVKIIDLAATLGETAGHMRRYLILDCCFAAAAVRAFMAPINDLVQRKTLDAFPPNGTTLLCASDAHDSASAPLDSDHTIFSGSMLSVLLTGEPTLDTGISLSLLGQLVRARIREAYRNYSGLPEVHSPVQTEGNIAGIPLFPNVARRANGLGRKGTRDPRPKPLVIEGIENIRISISQIFKLADFLIYPSSVRAKKLNAAFNDVNKMRRVLNNRTEFPVGTLGSLRPVTYTTSCNSFWRALKPDFRDPNASAIGFLPFELSLTNLFGIETLSGAFVDGALQGLKSVLNAQVSARLRVYPPGVGVIRLNLSLTFRGSVDLALVTRIARSIKDVLFVHVDGSRRPYEDILVNFIEQVTETLFAEQSLSLDQRRWDPPNLMYGLSSKKACDLNRYVHSLSHLMHTAPGNAEASDSIEGRIRQRIEGAHWQNDHFFALGGQRISILFLDRRFASGNNARREWMSESLSETGELIAAGAYAEKSFAEEIEEIASARKLDEGWYPDQDGRFEHLRHLLTLMRKIFQATASLRIQLQNHGAGVLMPFAKDLWQYDTPLELADMQEQLGYIASWAGEAFSRTGDTRVLALQSVALECGKIQRPFRPKI